MHSRGRTLFVLLALSSSALWADPGDVEGSRDYPGFPRLAGFSISDYDEDNPSELDFPISRPLATDADYVEMVHVKGHRYVIRYELNPGATPHSLLQTQQHYEKLAETAGFTVEKTGAVGNVNETFHLKKGDKDIWVYLEPSMSADVLTVMESSAPAPPPNSDRETAPEADDPLYAALVKDGHVVLPISFQPSKPELGADAKPVIDRVVKMLQDHPDLLLRIEGHTDDTGDAGDNQRLSTARARAVRSLLIAAGIDKERLVAVGLGGLVPVADDNTAEGREKNRRIELVVPKDASAFHPAAPNGMNYYPKSSGGSSSTP